MLGAVDVTGFEQCPASVRGGPETHLATLEPLGESGQLRAEPQTFGECHRIVGGDQLRGEDLGEPSGVSHPPRDLHCLTRQLVAPLELACIEQFAGEAGEHARAQDAVVGA